MLDAAPLKSSAGCSRPRARSACVRAPARARGRLSPPGNRQRRKRGRAAEHSPAAHAAALARRVGAVVRAVATVHTSAGAVGRVGATVRAVATVTSGHVGTVGRVGRRIVRAAGGAGGVRGRASLRKGLSRGQRVRQGPRAWTARCCVRNRQAPTWWTSWPPMTPRLRWRWRCCCEHLGACARCALLDRPQACGPCPRDATGRRMQQGRLGQACPSRRARAAHGTTTTTGRTATPGVTRTAGTACTNTIASVPLPAVMFAVPLPAGAGEVALKAMPSCSSRRGAAAPGGESATRAAR